jgi:c(7)-type cytochrome triheme protein
VFLAVGLVAGLAPLVGLAVPDGVRIPAVRPHPEGTPAANALFSHWSHGAYRCYACHPGVFPQALEGFTHADMGQGRYCGHCHGGGEAPAIPTYTCERCHVPR